MFFKIIIIIILFTTFNFKEKIVFQNIVENNIKNVINYSIVLDKYNLEIPIKYGTNDYILDQNVVGIMETFNNFNQNKNTVLAGHNYDSVFKNLYDMTIDDVITIKGLKGKKYVITEKHIIKENDMSYFRQGTKEIITLITCINYNQRLVVILVPL